MKTMDKSGDRVALVTDERNVLLGIMTDGDVRRFILSGRALDETGHRRDERPPNYGWRAEQRRRGTPS